MMPARRNSSKSLSSSSCSDSIVPLCLEPTTGPKPTGLYFTVRSVRPDSRALNSAFSATAEDSGKSRDSSKCNCCSLFTSLPGSLPLHESARLAPILAPRLISAFVQRPTSTTRNSFIKHWSPLSRLWRRTTVHYPELRVSGSHGFTRTTQSEAYAKRIQRMRRWQIKLTQAKSFFQNAFWLHFLPQDGRSLGKDAAPARAPRRGWR
jgi:hypothetical protein